MIRSPSLRGNEDYFQILQVGMSVRSIGFHIKNPTAKISFLLLIVVKKDPPFDREHQLNTLLLPKQVPIEFVFTICPILSLLS